IDSQDPDIQIDPAGQSQTQSTQSRQSQLQPSKKTSTKQKQKPPTKRKQSKKTVKSNEESDSDESGDNPIDHVQDSDAKNSKVQKLNIKKSTQFDDILDYYEAPFHAKDNNQGEKLMFKCRWCAKVFKKSAGKKSNLIKHCDGNIDQIPCSSRLEAIKKGAKLPLTAKDAERGSIKSYLKKNTFDARVFNQLLVMWLIRSALPWNWIEDFLLLIAFNYARHGVHIYS
ncbi:hypothetical protein PTTG_30780, partial [Puccinia triticina 1-1 BBBD Race 1]